METATQYLKRTAPVETPPTKEQLQKALYRIDIIEKAHNAPPAMRQIAKTGLIVKKSRPFIPKPPRTPKYAPYHPPKPAPVTTQPEQEIFNKSNFEIASMAGLDRAAYLSRKFDAEQLEALRQAQEVTATPAEQIADFYGKLGATIDQAMTLQEFNKLSGHQRRALSCGLNPYHTDIPFDQLSNAEMVELAASIKRRIHGIADPAPDTTRNVSASQWD